MQAKLAESSYAYWARISFQKKKSAIISSILLLMKKTLVTTL